MKRLKNFAVAVAMFLASCTSAFAGDMTMAAKDGAGNVVTLRDDACTNQVALKQLPKLNALTRRAFTAGDLRTGNLIFNGKMYGTCWVVVEPFVAIMDDGDADDSLFPVPMGDFKVPESI